MTLNSFSSNLISRLSGVIFIAAKLLRFFFFLIFLLLLTGRTQAIAGYNTNQVVFFFLTFNLIDTLSQLFFREVYRFRQMVVSGNLDLVLIKPINPLFRSLMGGTDPFDLFMLLPYTIFLVVIAAKFSPTSAEIFAYVILLTCSMTIATAFHILILALGILTTEIDHAVMIYRDIMSTGRVPIDIYREPVRGFLTFIIPVGIMITFPAKAFLGLQSFGGIVFTVIAAVFFLYVSLRFWHYALTKYTSASS